MLNIASGSISQDFHSNMRQVTKKAMDKAFKYMDKAFV